MAKLTFIGQMDDGAEYATDGSRVYQLVPGQGRKRAVAVEPEREARVRSLMSARRAEAAGKSPDEMPERSVMGDLGRLAMAGGARFVGDIGRVAGLESVERAGDRGAEYWRESVSPETQAEMEKPFLSEEGGIGPGLTSPTKIAGTVAESVLPMGVGMAGGASLARAAIGAGASPAAAGLVGGAIGEGTVAGVMSAGQVSTLIDQIPEDRIALAEPYQQAYHSLPGTMDERARRAQAREIVKRQAMGDVGPLVALATAAFGAPSGMAIGRIIGGETGKSLLSTMVKQGLLEGVVQEAPQSAAEQAIQNRTIQRTADPMQDPNEGLAEAAVGGAVAGTAMGGAMGPLAHAAAREPEPPPPAPRAPPAAPPPVKIAGALPSPTMVVDSQGNAEMASARAQRLQDAERRAREAEQAGDMEGALRIRQEALALLQGEDVPPEAPPPPAAPLALPAPSAPPIIADAQGNAETAAQREARMADMERRARAAELSGDMETAIRLRREMHAPQLAPQAPPETLGGDGIDAAFLDPEAIDIMGAPEQTGISELDAALGELDALVGAAPRAAPAPPAAGIEVGKGGQLERIEAAPPPPDESAPFDPGAPPAGGMGSTSYDIEQIDAAPAPAPQRALPPPTMVVDREGVAEPQSAADARRREQAARTEQQAADMERRAGELEKAGDTEQAMYLRKIAAGYPDEMTEQARAEASRNARLPEGLRDPRLAREFYRRHLEGMAGELLKGQNRNVERNEDGDVVRRLPSQNPPWFQSLGMTVAQVQHATKKALAGKKLGKREASAVQAMLDEIRAQRVAEEELEYARERRAAARAVRAEAAKDLPPIWAYEDDVARAGDLYEEPDYDPNWDGETRALFELYQDAAGVDLAAADAVLESGIDDSAAARRFAEIIHGRETGQGAEESRSEQGGGAPAEAAREAEGDTESEVAPPLLETYTEDDLRKRADADKAAAQAKAEEEAKAAADEARGSFALSGSDREADQAASRGQSGLFDRATSAGGQRGSDNSESAQSVSKRGLGRAEFGANLSQGPSSAEQLDSALGVPRDGPKGSRVDSSVPEGGPNNLVAYSQTLGDLGYADTLMQHGYRALDVPGQARVLKAVLSFIYDSKVLRSIVSAIPVPVMNNLVGPKFSTQDVLDDRAVLIHALATNNDLGVLAAAIDAIVSAPTVSVAEIPLVDFGRATKKRSTAAETFDSDSHEAATSAISVAPLPSKAQRDAGNYRLGHIRIMGLDISIENPEGSIRTGLDANGKPWAVKMKAAYGYIKGTVGKDKDHVDVFVKPMTPENWDGTVFVVDQKKTGNGHFDEHKVMIGYPDLAAAEKAYRSSYTAGWDGIRAITPAPFAEFKDWLASGDTTKPYAERNGDTQPAKSTAPEPKKAAPAPKEDDRQPLITQYQATMRALHEGTATVEDYKASFRAILEQPEAVKAQIALDSKDAILKGVGPSFAYRYKAEKKDAIVNAAYDAILAGYALGKSYGPTSYFMSRDGLKDHERKKREALAELVESQTDETLAEYAAEVKRTREENAASRAKAVEAIENPKTLDDFRSFMSFHLRNGKSESEARLSLTPEQRTRYDELWAESTREAREARKREAKTQVRAAGQSVAGGIVETKHTRDGYDLFVVRLEERVSAEDYRTLLSSAKRLGGWYSKFRGNGAVPGWQFKTRESAEAFQKLAGGDTAAAEEVVSARRDAFEDDRSQTAVQRLNEMADRLEERAEESLGRDRKQNTERRARMAASAEAAAQQELALAKTMRNLARSIEAGEAKFLDAVRQKAQVEMLTTLLRNAKDAELRHKYPAYIDYERHRGEPATEETVDFATFPSFTAFRSDLATLGRQLLEVEGTKAMGQALMKVADDVTDAYIEFAKANFHKVATFARGDQLAKFERREDAERAIIRSGFRGKAIVLPLKRGENVIVLSPSESINRGIWQGDGDKRITLKREFGMELVEKLGRVNRRKNRVTVPYQFEAAHDRLKSLSRLGIETPAEFRSALREFVRLREVPPPADRVKELERSMIGRQNDGLDFFPTPQSIADQMVEAAELAPGMRVLEPSAGWGHIAERIREAGIDPDVIEVSSKRRELLEAKGFRLVGSDFMDLKGRSGFTYGDIFRAPDGTVGVMRSSGGMGSNRVGLDPLDADGKPDRRRFQWHDFDDLTPVKRKDDPLGATVPRSDLTALEESRDIVRGDVLSSVRQAIRWYDRGDYAGAAELINRATRQAEFNPAALDRFGDIEMRLNAAAEGQYDRILMNPPFSDGRDIAHVRHAFDLLKPGGRLVAIMGEGAFFQSNKRAEEFRAWLEEVGGTEEKLPDGAFTDPSLPVTTGVAARMVVIERPPSDRSSQFSNPDSPAFAGLSVSEVENAIGPAVLGVSDAVGMRISVVASNAELPASVRRDLKPGQRPHGVLTPEGEVFIVAGNMRTLRAARAAFAHEVIGHLGINQVIGDWEAVRQRIRWLVKSGNRRALEIDADLSRRYPNTDPDTFAREFIALAAERAHDGPVAQLMTRVRAAIRRFLAKLGLRRVFQDWEIDVWLSDSRRYLRTGKRRGSAPQTNVYSMADERERFLWDVMPTANGPAFQNDDITLFPGGVPMAGGWGGANGYSVIDNETGQKIATLVVSLDGDRISDIHWIEAAERGRGAGMRTVRSIIANSDTPVRVTSILHDARGFWNKMGAYSYDENSNAYINWETHSGPEEDAGLVQGGAEEAGAGGGQADGRSAEGQEGEVTDSAAFRRWFGDSKVVDADGNPLVVYHGTGKNFSEFLTGTSSYFGPGGIFFTDSPSAASAFANQSTDHPNVMPVLLRMENPYVVDFEENGDDVTIEGLKTRGFDGIIRPSETEEGEPDTMYVVFSGGQIKSAIGNRGTFNSSDPRIQYSNPSDRFDQKAKDWLADHLKSNKRVSFWSRTVGTMYHLAEKVPQFKAVFDAGQEFLSDVSRIAVEAEGLAPGLFRQMTTVEKAFKTGTASAKDVAAISKAVYAGTLSDQRVYADDELRDKFGLMPAQIGLYRQAIRTAHKSLDDLTLSSIYRMAATLEIPKGALRAARERSAGTEEFMASIYADFLKPARDSLNERAEEIQADIDELEMAERQETDEEALENIRGELSGARAELAEVEKERDGLRKAIEEMYKAKARMEQLKAEGYFPLMRFGKYTVDVESDQIDPDTGRPERIYFGMFETEAEANTMARLMQVEYPRADVSTGIASQDDWRLFPGLTADVVESFARLTGQSENELFQDYIRLAVSNRSAMKRFINRKGVPGFNEDVNRTLATFVLSNARLASSHYHMGEMRKAVDEIPKKMGDVKDMATRLVLYLTNPQEEWAGLRGFMFFHFLGGSLASALTNLTQVPMVTMPWLSQYGARAAAGALKWTRPGTKPTDAAHKEALKRAEDEGIVSPQEVYNLMATARGGSLGAGRVLSSRPVQTALYVWGSLFSAAEQHNRRVTFNAAFELAQKRRERDPYGFAVRAVEQTQFVYNRGNRPAWGRGIGAPLFTFKQFSISYLELLARMPAKQKLLMVALLVLAAGLEGLPFEEDLEDIIDTIAQWNGYAWSTRAELETWAEKHLGRTLGPLLTRGVSGIGIPIDVQARLGLGNLIPGTALGKPSSLDPGKEALEVLGAPGGVLKSLGYAGQSAARGDWYGALWSAAPRAVQNAMKGVQMWQEGQYLDPQQRLVTETTRGDAVAKAIGFHPTTVSDVQRSQRQVDGIVQLHRVTEDGIADTWARGIVFKKPEMVEEARQRLRTWNTDNPEHKIVIAPRQITQRVRTLRLTQRERYLKTVPKELRQQAAAGLE